MHFIPTPLSGAYLIDLDKKSDARGFFARLFCQETFIRQGLEGAFMQANCSLSKEEGTLRGMHYQLPPMAETKLVRCIQGALYDIIVDLRPQSQTFGRSFGVELSQDNRMMLYIPRGFAHGFLTLKPHTELFYLVSMPYSPSHERGIRWNDPHFSLAWPKEPKIISERDSCHPDFDPTYHLAEHT